MIENFAGNGEIKEILKSAAKTGRLPHAFIIEGEEGSGRTTLARIISAISVCSANREAVPCGECKFCKSVMNGDNADVLTYVPEGATFKIDTVRKIKESAYLMPIEAEKKVFILKDADKMNEPAQNALLKTLEEPPAFSVFILIVKNASSLLTTVRSRCVTLSVNNPSVEEGTAYLERTTDYTYEQIASALGETRGNIGKALLILGGALRTVRQHSEAILEAVARGDRYKALEIMAAYEKDRVGYISLLSELEHLSAEKLTSAARGQREALSAKKLIALSGIIKAEYDRHRKHTGMPLSVPISSTTLIAEMFAD